MKKIEYKRQTKETNIQIEFLLNGNGKSKIDTSLGYLDHFLTLFCFWGNFDLQVIASGDIQVDAHHLVEDIGLCLGDVFKKSLAGKKGINRMSWVRVPMDEALVEVVVDLSGRPYFVLNNDEILPQVIFGQERDIWREFFKSFANKAQINLHINFIYGKNGHHLIEAAFKGFGIALRKATQIVFEEKTMSTKGLLE
ncbi:imidazoleglycerol-phosphate dehydratase HisB [Desulfothermus sp.]